MKKIHVVILVLVALGIATALGGYLTGYFVLEPEVKPESQCETAEMIFYYAEWCGWCQKVKNEGAIQKLEGLGVDVTEINVDVGPIEHEFRGIPTFVINNEIYSGYRTFEQLKELLGCE